MKNMSYLISLFIDIQKHRTHQIRLHYFFPEREVKKNYSYPITKRATIDNINAKYSSEIRYASLLKLNMHAFHWLHSTALLHDYGKFRSIIEGFFNFQHFMFQIISCYYEQSRQQPRLMKQERARSYRTNKTTDGHEVPLPKLHTKT